MKHIVEEFTEPIYDSAIWNTYFEGLRVGVLDIETTGLSPAYDRFILGCLYDVTKGEMHQVFAQSVDEEAETLAEYMMLLDDVDMVVTYNGRRFDMPFIERRLVLNGMANPGMPYNLDLYPAVRYHSPIRQFTPNLRQKTLEDYMGLWTDRTDEIDGAQSVMLYMDYCRTGDPEMERQIMLHNSDDVKQLARLTGVIAKCDFHSAMKRQGFPVKHGDRLLEVSEIAAGSKGIRISGIQRRGAMEYMGFELNGQPVTSRFHDTEFEITIPVQADSSVGDKELNEFAAEMLKTFLEEANA